jgi:hypothetical protein
VLAALQHGGEETVAGVHSGNRAEMQATAQRVRVLPRKFASLPELLQLQPAIERVKRWTLSESLFDDSDILLWL